MKVFVWKDHLANEYCSFADTEEQARQQIIDVYNPDEGTLKNLINKRPMEVRALPKVITILDPFRTLWRS